MAGPLPPSKEQRLSWSVSSSSPWSFRCRAGKAVPTAQKRRCKMLHCSRGGLVAPHLERVRPLSLTRRISPRVCAARCRTARRQGRAAWAAPYLIELNVRLVRLLVPVNRQVPFAQVPAELPTRQRWRGGQAGRRGWRARRAGRRWWSRAACWAVRLRALPLHSCRRRTGVGCGALRVRP